MKRDEKYNQRIEVKVLPFYAQKIDGKTGEESDSEHERDIQKIDSILDNFIGNFESQSKVEQSKERDLLKLLNSLNQTEKDML